jgi:enterochelin esterase-like enzyme
LVERVPGLATERLMTFVWRDPPPGARPSIFASLGTIVPEELAMRPLGRTGVWYRSFRVPARARIGYGFSPLPMPGGGGSPKGWGEYLRSVVPDPENGRRLHYPKDPYDPDDVEVVQSVAELPGAPVQRWSRPSGRDPYSEESTRSKSRFLPNQRTVWVCLPPDFDPARVRYNLLVTFDGEMYRRAIPTPLIVANLVGAGRIGPTVVVLVGNGPGARTAELGGNPRFVDFLARELWPWLRRHHAISVPANRVVLAGSSLGGLTAAYAALRYPNLFGNALAQSGAFPYPCADPRGGRTTIMELFAHAPRRALRFYLDAGSLETAVVPGMAVSLLGGVRHMRDVLEAKGYPVAYAEFAGGHDYAVWKGTLADGLLRLLGAGRGRRSRRKST